MQNILHTDISSVFKRQNFSEDRRFFVYAHLDTTRKIRPETSALSAFCAINRLDYYPFYIGKGCGERCENLNRNETHRKIRQKIEDLGYTPKVVKIRENLTELEALSLESKFIDIFGL